MKNLYSIADIVSVAIDKYHMNDSETLRKTYYQYFRRTMKKIGMFDIGEKILNGKNHTMFYTEQQMHKIFCTEKIYNYVRENSKDEEIRKSDRYKEVKEKISNRRQAQIDFLGKINQEYFDTLDTPCITNQELNNKKFSIMIEAIFNYIFGEFNTELLENDLNNILLADDLDLTVEIIEAENRLNNPKGNYFQDVKKPSIEEIATAVAKKVN